MSPLEQVLGTRGTHPPGSSVPGMAQAQTTGHTGSFHSGESHCQALHLPKKTTIPQEFIIFVMLIILLGCCTDFSPFPLNISRSWGSEERLQGPGKGGGRTQHSNRNLPEISRKAGWERLGELFFNPGNIPEAVNELRRRMLWKQRAHKQHAPAAQRRLRSPAFSPTPAAHPEQEIFSR